MTSLPKKGTIKKASHFCEALWAQQGSNLRPKDYESPTLTS